MAVREKKSKGGAQVIGGAIDSDESLELIRAHAQDQVNTANGEEIGMILVHIVKLGTPYSKWLAYSARAKDGEGNSRDFTVGDTPTPPPKPGKPVTVDKVENITVLHHNGWCYPIAPGINVWYC